MAQSDSGVKHIHSSDSYSVNMALSNVEVVTSKVYHLQINADGVTPHYYYVISGASQFCLVKALAEIFGTRTLLIKIQRFLRNHFKFNEVYREQCFPFKRILERFLWMDHCEFQPSILWLWTSAIKSATCLRNADQQGVPIVFL